jgi:ribosomal protein S27E
MDRNRERRARKRYTNPDGETIERVESVLRLECPRGCTGIEVAVYVESKFEAVTCPVCSTPIHAGTGTWGRMSCVFVPESVAVRERIDRIGANDDSEDA